MATFLDLPNEIRLAIAKDLKQKALLSLILTCRAFYSCFLPCLWADIRVQTYKGRLIPSDYIRSNAHLIQTIRLHVTLPGRYYRIFFPRLRALCLESAGKAVTRKEEQVKSQEKVEFLRMHSNVESGGVKKLVVGHKDGLSKGYWEVVEREWQGLEALQVLSEVVVKEEESAMDSFWRVCDRVQSLLLTGIGLPEGNIFGATGLSTLSFSRLQKLTLRRYTPLGKGFHKTWPQEMLEQIKKGAKGLKRIAWDVCDLGFPVQMVLDAFVEECWPELCELSIGDAMTCGDKEMALILRSLSSRRLTLFEPMNDTFGPLTYACLKDMYFGQLTNLHFGDSSGCTSAIVQEVLTECVNLRDLDAPYIFVKDIATSEKPWGCLGLHRLVVYICKEEGYAGKAGEWEGRVFEQIARLKRLKVLELQKDPYSFGILRRMSSIFEWDTLDLRLASSRNSDDKGQKAGSDISCWSGLLQMCIFSFDGDKQRLAMDEASWMVEHWPEVRCISGEFRGVEEHDYAWLERLFVNRDISYYH